MPHLLLQFFKYDHLPEKLKTISAPFGELAHAIDTALPGNPEKTAALRKLLEAKDCAVRAMLFDESFAPPAIPMDPESKTASECAGLDPATHTASGTPA